MVGVTFQFEDGTISILTAKVSASKESKESTLKNQVDKKSNKS